MSSAVHVVCCPTPLALRKFVHGRLHGQPNRDVKIDWPYSLCIACLAPFDSTASGRRSEAHIVPESLGGRISVTCLCRGCNSAMGSGFEDELPFDPTMRAEIERFAGDIPVFKRQLTKAGRTYVGKSPRGVMTMKRQSDGSFRAVDTAQPDGSRLTDSNAAAQELRGRLLKRGRDAAEVDAILEKFAQGQPVDVDELTFIPHAADLDIELPWDANLADACGYLSIAMLFLALNIGDRIYGDEFAPVRRVLTGGGRDEDATAWSVTASQFMRDSEAWHRLEMMRLEDRVAIDITLFGRWHYRVSFSTFVWRGHTFGMFDAFGERRVYYKNLDTDEPTMELLGA